jgi:UDP-N-acetylmuramyl pentapeptide phosphotransferase/UDP-N-acetylglucosamine-1-phosphate transferase
MIIVEWRDPSAVSTSHMPMITQEVDASGMARGDHPMRTPVYGGLLIVAAMIGATLVWQHVGIVWLRDVLLVVALVAALAGWLMTFRDLSNPRPRR